MNNSHREQSKGRPGIKSRLRSTVLVVLGLLAAVLLAIAVKTAWGYLGGQSVLSAAARGEAIAGRFGCFACHGPRGSGGVADPASPSGNVPGWDRGTMVMYAQSDTDLRDWILHGALQGESVDKHRETSAGIIPMPSYEDELSKGELEALLAYLKVVSNWGDDIPDTAYDGWKVASRMGCFGCHGPGGTGRVPNPGSLKGYIPPWDGDEFAELVRDDDELRAWILDGFPPRLGKNPIARYFLEKQKTPMPAYRDYLSEKEVDNLVAYIRWTRKPQP